MDAIRTTTNPNALLHEEISPETIDAAVARGVKIQLCPPGAMRKHDLKGLTLEDLGL